MSHKHFVQTKTKGAGSLRATELYQVLCNRVGVMMLFHNNQHAFSKSMNYRSTSYLWLLHYLNMLPSKSIYSAIIVSLL